MNEEAGVTLINLHVWDNGNRYAARWRTHDHITFNVLHDGNGRPLHGVTIFSIRLTAPVLTDEQRTGAISMP